MIIATSNYKNCKTNILNTYSISKDKGEDAKYKGKSYPSLAPKKEFWNIWKSHINYKDEYENNLYYTEQYYLQVLRNLDPENIINNLYNSVLLCYEDNNSFCHRGLVAAWLELLLDIEVPEIIVKENNIEIVKRNPVYKSMMELTIRKFEYLNGYTSLHAFYLYTKSNKYLKYSKKEDDEEIRLTFENISHNYLAKANNIEKEYKEKQLTLKRKK